MSASEIVSPKRMTPCSRRSLAAGSMTALGNEATAESSSGNTCGPLRLMSHRTQDNETSSDVNETLKSRIIGSEKKGGMKVLQKKTVLTHGIQKLQKHKIKSKFASPTDRLLSPCSQKLNDHKSKLFVSKSNPTKLSFSRKQEQGDYGDDDGEVGYD